MSSFAPIRWIPVRLAPLRSSRKRFRETQSPLRRHLYAAE